jgi:hypothetical protein
MTMTICFNPKNKFAGCDMILMIGANIERFKEASKLSFLKTNLMKIGFYIADNEDNIFIKL